MNGKKSPLKLITVTGPIELSMAGIIDAHNHVWIERVRGIAPEAPIINNRTLISANLFDYHQADGGSIVDSQPGGCGRDGRVLRGLSETNRVNIVACTGFHLQKYYPDEFWLFRASSKDACQHFIYELQDSLEETRELTEVRAGFIKVACEETLAKSPLHLIEAAIEASAETGAAIEVHTEKGINAEWIIEAMIGFGLTYDRLVLCHMDKRPDFDLHRTFAQEGITLVYDTFLRSKYRPEENVWPLLECMVAEGYGSQVAIATDMADKSRWVRNGINHGLSDFITQIIPRLKELGFNSEVIQKLVGGNIASRLAGPFRQLDQYDEDVNAWTSRPTIRYEH